LDNRKREGLEARLAPLEARLAPLDSQLAEKEKRLAGYEQDLRELNKQLQTGIASKLDVANFCVLLKVFIQFFFQLNNFNSSNHFPFEKGQNNA
jgi:uncharacterized coiled-coil protein SlyX